MWSVTTAGPVTTAGVPPRDPVTRAGPVTTGPCDPVTAAGQCGPVTTFTPIMSYVVPSQQLVQS